MEYVTWKYNNQGHIEVWQGKSDMTVPADMYIQTDIEVDSFLEFNGISNKLNIGDWGYARDCGYFI